MRQVASLPVFVDGDGSFERETEEIVLRIDRSQTGHAIVEKIRTHGAAIIVPYSPADAAETGKFNASTEYEIITDSDGSGQGSRSLPVHGKIGTIHFSPSTWQGVISSNGQTFRLNYWPVPWYESDEVLLHEMVHLARILGGSYLRIKLRGNLAIYDDEEEFFAVMVTNIHISEKGKDHFLLLRGGHDDRTTPLPPDQYQSDVFLDQPNVFALVEQFCRQHPNIAPRLAKVNSRFNPIRAYYEWLKFPALGRYLKTEETPGPIPERITQHETRPALSDDALIRLLAPRFRAHDVAGYDKRVRHLEETFRHFNAPEASPLFVRLIQRAPSDKVAMLFHHRLNHNTRQKLLDILRTRMVPH
jgi:hypothetical protein